MIDVLKLLHEGHAFEWGHVALTPELHAEVWVNLHPWLSQPEALKPMAWQLIRNMMPAHQHIDVLVATHASSVPLAYELASQLKKPLNWLSEEVPMQGLAAETRVLLVTDVVRSGQTLLQAASRLGRCQLLGAASLVASSQTPVLPFPLHTNLRLPLPTVAIAQCEGCKDGHPLMEKWL